MVLHSERVETWCKPGVDSALRLMTFISSRSCTRIPPPRFVCLGIPLATCALPSGVFYLHTYCTRIVIVRAPRHESRRTVGRPLSQRPTTLHP